MKKKMGQILLCGVILLGIIGITGLQASGSFQIEQGELIAYTGRAKEVKTPDDVTVIQNCAFSGDMGHGTKLQKVTVTSNVKTIEEGAFSFTNADIIFIEDGVTTIGDHAFMDSYITEIYFPASVTKIGKQIMDTEEGLNGTKIHLVKDSPLDKYFTDNMPYGTCELIYDYPQEGHE